MRSVLALLLVSQLFTTGCEDDKDSNERLLELRDQRVAALVEERAEFDRLVDQSSDGSADGIQALVDAAVGDPRPRLRHTIERKLASLANVPDTPSGYHKRFREVIGAPHNLKRLAAQADSESTLELLRRTDLLDEAEKALAADPKAKPAALEAVRAALAE